MPRYDSFDAGCPFADSPVDDNEATDSDTPTEEDSESWNDTASFVGAGELAHETNLKLKLGSTCDYTWRMVEKMDK